MRHDPGSSYNMLEVYAAASLAAGTAVTSAINHGTQGQGATFLVSVGTFATGLVATLQHSSTLATDYTDEADATRGNTVSATFATAGMQQIDCPNPRSQYTRLKLVATGALVLSVTAIAGPKTLNQPTDN